MIAVWLMLCAAADDAQSYLDQARHYLAQEWYDDALQQLVIAVGRAEGDADPEAWYLLARVRYQLCDLQGAREAARTARDRAVDAEHVRLTDEFVSFLEERFGLVQFVSRRASTPPIRLALTSTLYDPDQKRFVARLAERLAGDTLALPATIGLPVGAYVVNGGELTVRADGTTTFDPNRPLGRGTPVVIELGAGGRSSYSSPLALRPMLDLSLGIPVGPVLIGPVLIYDPDPGEDWASVSGGLRVGVEIGDQWRVRPALSGRYGARGFIGAVELGLIRHDRDERGALGFGITVAQDLAFEAPPVPRARASLLLAIAL